MNDKINIHDIALAKKLAQSLCNINKENSEVLTQAIEYLCKKYKLKVIGYSEQ